MNLATKTFSLFLVAMTMSQATAFSVGGTFLSSAEKTALEKTAAAVATAGKGITGTSQQTLFDYLATVRMRVLHTRLKRTFLF